MTKANINSVPFTGQIWLLMLISVAVVVSVGYGEAVLVLILAQLVHIGNILEAKL